MERGLVRVAEAVGISMNDTISLGSGVCVAMISLSVFVVVRSLAGQREAFVAQLLVLVFFAPSPASAVSYTDIPVAALMSAATAF